MMKCKVIYLMVIMGSVCLVGCRTSRDVSSTKAYKQAIKNAQDEFASEGYRLVDTKRSSDIDGTKQDTYKFQDTTGNTMEYTVSYKVNNDEDLYYVENVHIEGCTTSDINAYERLCGSDSPINRVEKLKKDEEIKQVSAGKTVFWLVGFPFILLGGLVAGLAVGLSFI